MTTISWPTCPSDLYSSALDVVESIAGSSALDQMEYHLDPKYVYMGVTGAAALSSPFTSMPIVTFALASLGLYLSSTYDHRETKRALMETKISQIISESADKPKKALIIQSARDKTGALSMRTHVEKVRKLAETHAITRVIVKNDKDVLSLPPGQYDVVWIRSHGTPKSIELGAFFELNKESPQQYFYTLASKVKPLGKVILECCNVANASKADGNIAEYLASYCWNATVYAPLTEISGIFGLEFDQWGYPRFNDGFAFKGKPVTRVIEGPERNYLYPFV